LKSLSSVIAFEDTDVAAQFSKRDCHLILTRPNRTERPLGDVLAPQIRVVEGDSGVIKDLIFEIFFKGTVTHSSAPFLDRLPAAGTFD
jgi:hypothetical protein